LSWDLSKPPVIQKTRKIITEKEEKFKMAMIKCASCGKTVSDSNELCPYCGGKTDNTVRCPKCNSANIAVVAKGAGEGAGGCFGVVVTVLFGWLIGIITSIAQSAKGTTIKYKCNDCGKKFKVK